MGNSVRVRFAPSPTGFLHIGTARTALFNYVYAKRNNGKFILRIEDTDFKRSKPEFLNEILDSLKWLGLEPDEIYFQSERLDIYKKYAQKLVDEGKAFLKEGAIVFKYEFQEVTFKDLIRGKIKFTELPKSEEVLIKSDGTPTYNFACVIDDALLEISCVIRGDDHISNTPKQILLYKALGFKIPEFAHLPMILAEEGGKLSKRKGAVSIREFREQGFLAEGICNYLLLLGWSPKNNQEIITLEEAIKIFDLKDVKKTAATFSIDKLKWVNQNHIRKKSTQELKELLKPFLEKEKINTSDSYLEKVISLFKERIKTLKDFLEYSKYFFVDTFEFEKEALELLKKNLKNEFTLLIERFKNLSDFRAPLIEKEFRELVAELNIKAKDLIHPVRAALSGKRIGPSLFEMIEVLGKDRVIKRLEKAKEFMEV